MILPIAIGAAVIAGAASYVCGRGVVVKSGGGPLRFWRVRFACWRYFAEVGVPGASGPDGASDLIWSRVGTFTRGQMNAASALAAAFANPGDLLRNVSKNVKIVSQKFDEG